MSKNRNIHYDELVLETLRALRGKRSQIMLSRRLGFSFNQVGKWETGHKKILWDELVKLCSITKAPLDKSLLVHYKFQQPGQDISTLIKLLIGDQPISVISRQLEVSRHSLSAWLKGNSSPSFQEVCKLLSLYRGGEDHLMMFLASLIDDLSLAPVLKLFLEKKQKQILFSYHSPWLGAVPDCLQLSVYRKAREHLPGFVARCLRVSMDEEKKSLEFLVDVGVLEFRENKYFPVGDELNFQEQVLESLEDQEGNFKIREYWWAKALQYLQARPPWKSLTFAFQTFAVSKSAHGKIRQLSISYYKDVQRIVEEDTDDKELLQVMNLSFFSPAIGKER